MLTADTILRITEPERLFPNSMTAAQSEFHDLAKAWHPDRNKDPTAPAVFSHIKKLYDAAIEHIKAGKWQRPGSRIIIDRRGRTFAITFRKWRRFELGEMLIGMNAVTYVIPKEHEDLVIAGLRMIGSVRYPNPKMQAHLEKHFPRVAQTLETTTDYIVRIEKTKDLFLAADLVAYLGGKMDARHVAWLMSRLLELACCMEVTGRVHNGLTLDSVFVSPYWHSVALLGGWWYAVDAGRPMIAIPPAVSAVIPKSILMSKHAENRTDLESIRAIGRGALGDPSGSGLRLRADVPEPFANWLRLPAPKSAIDDYTHWQTVLTDSFGPRRFIKLSIDPDAVYPEGV